MGLLDNVLGAVTDQKSGSLATALLGMLGSEGGRAPQSAPDRRADRSPAG